MLTGHSEERSETALQSRGELPRLGMNGNFQRRFFSLMLVLSAPLLINGDFEDSFTEFRSQTSCKRTRV